MIKQKKVKFLRGADQFIAGAFPFFFGKGAGSSSAPATDPVTDLGADLLYAFGTGPTPTVPGNGWNSLNTLYFNNTALNDGQPIPSLYGRKVGLSKATVQYQSDFSVDEDGWTATPIQVTTAGGITHEGRANCLQITSTTSGGSHETGFTGWLGSEIYLKFSFFIPTANTLVNGFRVRKGNGDSGWHFDNYAKGVWHDIEIPNFYFAGTLELHLMNGVDISTITGVAESIYISGITNTRANVDILENDWNLYAANVTIMPILNDARKTTDFDGVADQFDADDLCRIIRLAGLSLGTFWFALYDDEGTGNDLMMLQIGKGGNKFVKMRINTSDQLEIHKYISTSTETSSIFTGQAVTRGGFSLICVKSDGTNYSAKQIINGVATDLGTPTNDDGNWYSDVALPTSSEGYMARDSGAVTYAQMGFVYHAMLTIVSTAEQDLNAYNWAAEQAGL